MTWRHQQIPPDSCTNIGLSCHSNDSSKSSLHKRQLTKPPGQKRNELEIYNMKITRLIALCFLITLPGFSQVENLIPEAKEIKLAFENLENNPHSTIYQEKYINVFPENAVLFRKVFAPAEFDQLYDGELYISKLNDLTQEYPDKIGYKLINLCVGLKKWEADAVGYIQHITMEFANSRYSNFISLTKNLNQKDLSTLIVFLADVENHSAYKAYQDFMDKLKKNNENALFFQFKKAKEERINQII
jgi:hypothetical protein